MRNPLLDAALDYVTANAWEVFPVKPRSKEPMTDHGFKDASSDPDRVRRWWKQQPDANIGIPTGRWFDVADIDPKGMAEFHKVAKEHGTDLDTITRARTGSGGEHYLFDVTDLGSRIGVLPGMDWKAKAAYIVVAPSMHPNGEPYQWIQQPNGVLAPAPDWWLQIVRKPALVTSLVPTVDGGNKPSAEYVKAAMDGEIEELRTAPVGKRNDTLNRASYALGRMIGAGWITRTQAESVLKLAAFACGLEEPEISRTIKSGVEDGIAHPRLPVESRSSGLIVNNEPKDDEVGTRDFAPNAAPTEFFSESGFVPDRIGKLLTTEGHIERGIDSRFYRYVDGVYRPDGEEWIAGRVRELLGERFRRRHMAEVDSWFKAAPPTTIALRQPIDMINVSNGLLDWRTGTLRPHDPSHMSTIRIPVRWNATAKCPRIDSFLIEVLPGDSIELVLEVVGYCMIPDNRLQRAVMLVGPGGNGKGTLLNLIRAFLGAVNVSARSLHDLGEDRFAKADLVGRLANICGDLDARAVERSDTFKMITGGDAITAERKYGHSFSFTPFTRLLFSANEVPLSADQTQAYFDRWLAIPMVKRFRDTNDEDHDLLAKLTTDAELEGLLVQAVEGLRRLIERGHFDVPASIKEEQKRFRQQIDTVIAFVGDACVLKESRWERRTHLYAAYQRWCQNNGRKALASRHVYFKLRDHFLLADKLRDGYDGFDGIGFVDEAERHLVTP